MLMMETGTDLDNLGSINFKLVGKCLLFFIKFYKINSKHAVKYLLYGYFTLFNVIYIFKNKFSV